jgi:L-fucose isomerase-like protein
MVCVGYLASSLHDKAFVDGIVERLRSVFSEYAGEVRDVGVITNAESLLGLGDCSAFIGFILTGGTESLMLEIRRSLLGVPMVFVAHDKANSLAALIEASPLLNMVEGTVAHYMGDVEGEEASREAVRALRVSEAASNLRGSRLGILGGVSQWLVYSRTTEENAKRRLGIQLIKIPLERVYERFGEVGAKDISVPDGLLGKHVLDSEVEKALRLYKAIKEVAVEHRLDALTIKCFDVIKDIGTTACLPLALLNSEGIVAGCEGDVPSTIAMMIAYKSTGKPGFMANPSVFYPDSILLAHCTAPITIAGEGYELKTHFESGIGVGVAAHIPVGEDVTVFRITPDLRTMRIFRGTIEKGSPFSNEHCRTQVKVKVSFDPKILLEDSIGNHHVLVLGNEVETIKMTGKLLGMKVSVLG